MTSSPDSLLACSPALDSEWLKDKLESVPACGMIRRAIWADRVRAGLSLRTRVSYGAAFDSRPLSGARAMAGSIEGAAEGEGCHPSERGGAGGELHVPSVISGNTLYISGQVPFVDGKISHHRQARCAEFKVEDGYALLPGSAPSTSWRRPRPSALGGDLDRVVRVGEAGRLRQFDAGVHRLSRRSINGASDLMAEAFGDSQQACPGRRRRRPTAAGLRRRGRCDLRRSSQAAPSTPRVCHCRA